MRNYFSYMADNCFYLKDVGGGKCKYNNSKDSKCKMTLDYCAEDSKQYHKICDRIWDLTEEDMKKMDLDTIDRTIVDASVCIYMREKHMDLCVQKTCQDDGHSGAIKKIRNKMIQLRREIYDREMKKLFKEYMDTEFKDELVLEKMKWEKDKTLRFPPIEDVSWYDFFKSIINMNGLKYKIYPADPVLGGFILECTLSTGEVVTAMEDTEDECYKEWCYLIVTNFATKKYAEDFRKSFYEEIYKKVEEEKPVYVPKPKSYLSGPAVYPKKPRGGRPTYYKKK